MENFTKLAATPEIDTEYFKCFLRNRCYKNKARHFTHCNFTQAISLTEMLMWGQCLDPLQLVNIKEVLAILFLAIVCALSFKRGYILYLVQSQARIFWEIYPRENDGRLPFKPVGCPALRIAL